MSSSEAAAECRGTHFRRGTGRVGGARGTTRQANRLASGLATIGPDRDRLPIRGTLRSPSYRCPLCSDAHLYLSSLGCARGDVACRPLPDPVAAHYRARRPHVILRQSPQSTPDKADVLRDT